VPRLPAAVAAVLSSAERALLDARPVAGADAAVVPTARVTVVIITARVSSM
jgi:hypothetical protein